MKTAEEFLKKEDIYKYSVKDLLIEFAKLHVEAALNQAAGKVMLGADLYDFIEGTFSPDEWFDKNSILNAYPLENIK